MQGGLAASYINMTDDEAVDLARERFGIEGRPTRFATEKDDTFRIAPASGPRFILKVANPIEDIPEIDLQVQVLDHVAARAPDLPVPRVIPNDKGERHFNYLDRAGQNRQVRMMSYLEGQPLSEVPSTALGRAEIGKLLARLRLALADFSHPSDSRVVAWDVKNLLTLRDLLAEITDAAQRRKVEAALERFAAIETRLKQCRMQVLHNDFTRSNIVVDASLPGFVSGIIDFGDTVRTAIAIDASTAMLNQLPVAMDGDVFADGRDLLKGYLSIADLTAEELSLIPHLIFSRLATRLLLSTAMANRVPSVAAYVLRNNEQTWVQMDWFIARSMDEISDQLMDFAR
ncbi:phosphotransferase [Tardiphaga robiniae]|uniref:Hydroxylysine kinase n=2 Tax=Tardiphaga robiniae TaxID=943830 RepID=A0A7G6U8A4_9BRAD|nr:phosphotransferase [Tardiphaga robiniae]